MTIHKKFLILIAPLLCAVLYIPAALPMGDSDGSYYDDGGWHSWKNPEEAAAVHAERRASQYPSEPAAASASARSGGRSRAQGMIHVQLDEHIEKLEQDLTHDNITALFTYIKNCRVRVTVAIGKKMILLASDVIDEYGDNREKEDVLRSAIVKIHGFMSVYHEKVRISIFKKHQYKNPESTRARNSRASQAAHQEAWKRYQTFISEKLNVSGSGGAAAGGAAQSARTKRGREQNPGGAGAYAARTGSGSRKRGRTGTAGASEVAPEAVSCRAASELISKLPVCYKKRLTNRAHSTEAGIKKLHKNIASLRAKRTRSVVFAEDIHVIFLYFCWRVFIAEEGDPYKTWNLIDGDQEAHGAYAFDQLGALVKRKNLFATVLLAYIHDRHYEWHEDFVEPSLKPYSDHDGNRHRCEAAILYACSHTLVKPLQITKGEAKHMCERAAYLADETGSECASEDCPDRCNGIYCQSDMFDQGDLTWGKHLARLIAK